MSEYHYPFHYEDIPKRGLTHRYRVGDSHDNVVASFETEDEARKFVREHNLRWVTELLNHHTWRF